MFGNPSLSFKADPLYLMFFQQSFVYVGFNISWIMFCSLSGGLCSLCSWRRKWQLTFLNRSEKHLETLLFLPSLVTFLLWKCKEANHYLIGKLNNTLKKTPPILNMESWDNPQSDVNLHSELVSVLQISFLLALLFGA